MYNFRVHYFKLTLKIFLEIIWYKDGKVIRTDNQFIVENKEKQTTCTIRKAVKDLEGVYMCKAVSDIGVAVTKATLQVYEAGRKVKKIKQQKEKVKTKQVLDYTEEIIDEPKEKQPIDDKITSTDNIERQVVEKTDTIEKIAKNKSKVIVDKGESVETVEIVSNKKVVKKDKTQPEQEPLSPIITPEEYMVSSQDQKEETVQPFEGVYETKKGITTMVDTDRVVAEINELLEVINAKEFGPGESPLRELAKIGYMLRKGVTIDEIESLYDSQYFPSLRVPQSQSALVQLVERQGHGALITEVLTEETAQEEDVIAAKVGFKAFLKMVELKHSSVEEVIAHFYPEDFKPRSWEQKEANEVNNFTTFFINMFHKNISSSFISQI